MNEDDRRKYVTMVFVIKLKISSLVELARLYIGIVYLKSYKISNKNFCISISYFSTCRISQDISQEEHTSQRYLTAEIRIEFELITLSFSVPWKSLLGEN